MKKNLLLVFAMVIMAFCSFSQTPVSLSLSDSTGPIPDKGTCYEKGVPSDDIVSYIFVKNTSQNPIWVKVKKVELDIIQGTINTFCWGLCFAPSVFISPDSIYILPGRTDSTDFSGHYSPSNVKGVSSLRYVFFNCADHNDSVSATVMYSAYPLGIENLTRGKTLLNAYPDPANSVINFDYNGVKEIGSVLVIRNVLGSVVKEIRLENGSGKVTVPVGGLNEGFYFCSLLVNDKPVLTKKIIILH